MVQRLTFLQIDPTAAVAPSADLVVWSQRPARARELFDFEYTLEMHKPAAKRVGKMDAAADHKALCCA